MICDVSKTKNRYAYVFIRTCAFVSVDSFYFSIVSIILLMSPSTRWKKVHAEQRRQQLFGCWWNNRVACQDIFYFVSIHIRYIMRIYRNYYKETKNPKEDADRASINHSLSVFEKKEEIHDIYNIYNTRVFNCNRTSLMVYLCNPLRSAYIIVGTERMCYFVEEYRQVYDKKLKKKRYRIKHNIILSSCGYTYCWVKLYLFDFSSFFLFCWRL